MSIGCCTDRFSANGEKSLIVLEIVMPACDARDIELESRDEIKAG